MSETCFRIRYPPYAGPLHLTDFQRATLALGLCIRSYGLAQAIFTLGEKLQFFPQLRGRQHWTICSSLHNCVLAKLHWCAQIQQRDTLKNISLHVQLCMCTYALICSSLMCCNMQCARTDILHPQPSSYIAFCMYCHMCQCASAIYSLNWISLATHALPLGFKRKTLIAATNTRRNFFHTSSSRHSFYLPAVLYSSSFYLL